MATERISRAQQHKCMIVRTADGARTSVSIPAADVERFITICYGRNDLFRRHLNAAVIETPVRAGRSRSQLVRANLLKRMAAVEAMRAQMSH